MAAAMAACMKMLFAVLVCAWMPSTEAQLTYDLRLVNFTSTNAQGGRLEIYWSGQWGTVCSDGFGFTEADVACRQLGYQSATSEATVSGLNYPSVSFSTIWLDNVNCDRSDTALYLCSHNGFGIHNCTHSQDVAIICTSVVTNEGDLRIVRPVGTSSGQGRLEIFLRGQWGTVCSDGFGITEARVACRQLGYSDYSRYGTIVTLGFNFPDSDVGIWLDNVDCDSFDTTLLSCSHNGIGVHNCVHSEDVGLVCEVASSGDLRLVSSSFSTSGNSAGRLEIYLRGEWGTVCDDGFGQTEANVACRQLGFLSASNYGNVVQLGYSQASSSTETWLDNVNCFSSSTSSLLSCSHNGIGVENCGHSEDVALVCSSSIISSDPTTTTTSVGGIVGGVITVFIIFLLVPVCVFCLYIGSRRRTARRVVRQPVRTTVPTPGVVATTTTTTTTTTEKTPAAYPAQPQQAPPPHPDSTFQKAPPPAYSEATAYPASYPPPGAPYPPQGAPYPPQGAPYPPQGAPYSQYPPEAAPYGAPYPQQYPQDPNAAYPPEAQSPGYVYPGGDAPTAPPPS